MYGDLLLDQHGVNFLDPAPLDLELLHMLTTFHWNALGSTLGWWFCHNNTASCNEKFWVEQVTPPPPREGQGGGGARGGGVNLNPLGQIEMAHLRPVGLCWVLGAWFCNVNYACLGPPGPPHALNPLGRFFFVIQIVAKALS